MDEAQVQHLVGLVQHQEVGLGQHHGTAVQQVDQTAGGSNQKADATFHFLDLAGDAGAADDQTDLQVRPGGKRLKVIGDLFGQFAGRGQHQRFAGARVRADAAFDQRVNHRQTKGRRLA